MKKLLTLAACLVVLGDPSILSAVVLNATDADHRQFALNVMRWLSRRLT